MIRKYHKTPFADEIISVKGVFEYEKCRINIVDEKVEQQYNLSTENCTGRRGNHACYKLYNVERKYENLHG